MKAQLACGHTSRPVKRKILKWFSGLGSIWCPTCKQVKPIVKGPQP